LVAIPISGEGNVCCCASGLFIDLIPDDMENQQALRLAGETDPVGERTIGLFLLFSPSFSTGELSPGQEFSPNQIPFPKALQMLGKSGRPCFKV